MNRALTFDEMRALAAPAAKAGSVPLALILAVAQQESQWKPWAVREEPHVADASRGLMQMLYSTARDAGYAGAPGVWSEATQSGTGLYDPSTNLWYGTRHLQSLFNRAGGDVERAVSAYNAGWGNAKRATQVTQFCEVWKSTAPATGRVISRDCARIRLVQPGEWMNQPYVSSVIRLFNQYRDQLPSPVAGVPGGVVPGDTTRVPQSTDASAAGSVVSFIVNPVTAIVAAVIGVAAWLLKGK